MNRFVAALLYGFIMLCLDIVIARGEDEMYSTQTDHDDLGANDKILLFFMFLFFGFIVSLSGSFLLYVSYLDDRLMNEYMDRGILVEGDVVATEFTREGGGDIRALADQKEYFVFVEYTQLLSTNYPVRCRKRVRILESDFFSPNQLNQAESKNTFFQDPCSCHTDCTSEPEQDSADSFVQFSKLPQPQIQIVMSAESFFKHFHFEHGKKLQLLVLPNNHLSALPIQQVERRLSTKYRLYSFTFVSAAILIGVFCLHLAEQYLDPESEYVNAWLLYLGFVLLALSPIPCIHYFLHQNIQRSLEYDYFETGEVIKGGQDDSSLSTYNSESIIGGYRASVESLSTLA